MQSAANDEGAAFLRCVRLTVLVERLDIRRLLHSEGEVIGRHGVGPVAVDAAEQHPLIRSGAELVNRPECGEILGVQRRSESEQQGQDDGVHAGCCIIHGASVIDLDAAFHRLGLSAFRRKFRLQGKELAYLQTWGLPHVMKQGADLISHRLAPAEPLNDGRQTPWRNHPIFVAQHATGTCCRGCLEKTHAIAKGSPLTPEEMAHVLSAIERWLRGQCEEHG